MRAQLLPIGHKDLEHRARKRLRYGAFYANTFQAVRLIRHRRNPNLNPEQLLSNSQTPKALKSRDPELPGYTLRYGSSDSAHRRKTHRAPAFYRTRIEQYTRPPNPGQQIILRLSRAARGTLDPPAPP